MANYVFPTSEMIMKIAQEKLPTLTQDDPIFKQFPIVNKNVINVRWEQKDNYVGLQRLRGVGGEPQRVQPVAQRSYMYEPGVYGEYMDINEKEMLERRPMGSWDGFIDLNDLVMDKQDQLLNRRVDRVRWILWTLLVTGSFYVPMPNAALNGPATAGSAGHSDAYNTVTSLGQFGLQQYTVPVPYSTFATSSPLQDFRNVQLLYRGRSIDLGPRAIAYMSRGTYNNIVRNSNPNDFGGKRAGNFNSTLTSLADVNSVLLDADMPTIVIYDGGYIDEANTFQLFLPLGTIIVVGARTNGDSLGEYWMTRNMINPGGEGGPYQVVIDHTSGPTQQIPPNVEVHDGHAGGPIIWYPSAIVRMIGG